MLDFFWSLDRSGGLVTVLLDVCLCLRLCRGYRSTDCCGVTDGRCVDLGSLEACLSRVILRAAAAEESECAKRDNHFFHLH